MREIKFRAWDKVNGCWINIDSIVLSDDGSIAYLVPEEDDMPPYLEDEVELMQYTKLNDINGVKIAEGDILKSIPVRRQYPTAFSLEESVGTLIIGAQRLTVGGQTYDTELYDYEVIGNKFENPELLE